MEEDRRLCYVAITRAKKQLYLLRAASRMLFGNTGHNPPSVFLSDIPKQLLHTADQRGNWPTFGFGSRGGAGTGHKDVYKPRTMPWDDDDQTPRYKISPTPATPKPAAGGGITVAGSRPAASPAPAGQYVAGQVVRHKVFGRGVIRTARAMGNDTLLTIAFDGVGEKKIMANFAKLETE